MRVEFFGPIHGLKIDLNKFLQDHDIIGREDIVLKIVSENNEEWKVSKVSSS